MKNQKFDIYEGFNKKKKKYVVVDIDADYDVVINYCKKMFKCSAAHIDFTIGYIYKRELYLDDPCMPETKIVGVAYYVG